MKKIVILGFCALCIIGLSACSTQRFNVNPNPIVADEPSYEGTNHFLFWGLGQTQTMNPGSACGPQGVNRIEAKETFLNGLLNALTFGIYAPRQYAVYCNGR